MSMDTILMLRSCLCYQKLNLYFFLARRCIVMKSNNIVSVRNDMTKCELNQIFLGEVASVQNYGAFVRIPGTPQQGLIHRSQVSSAHVDNVADILQKGERVWCKVISVAEDGKIGLSMKHVNQGNGMDLDPNGVELQKDIQRRKTPGTVQHKAIQLEAVLNTTCSKCGTRGHLSKDCFMSPDGKKYELIPEIEEKVIPSHPTEEKVEKKGEKKHKLKKKKKKSKKSKQTINDNDTEEKEKSTKKIKKSFKERKKHKKKHSSNDSSDSSSSSHDVKAHKRKHSEDYETRTKKCKYSKTKHPD